MISNVLNFFEPLKIALINMIIIMVISAKMATLGFFRIKVCWNKGYGLIISAHDVPTKFYDVTHIFYIWPWNFRRIKTKIQKVLGVSFFVCRSCRRKTGKGPFCPPPFLNRINVDELSKVY